MEEKTIIRKVRRIPKIRDEASQGRATLLVISGHQSGQMFPLMESDIVIGRCDECSITIEDSGASRKHARIECTLDGVLQLVDLKSTNGTYLNDRRIDVHTLRDGDKIQIGSTTILKFSYQDYIEAQFQKELYESAIKDGLTKIYNRNYFNDRFRSEFSYAVRHRCSLSLVIFDIDHFKRINDTHGHSAGDYVLHRLSKVMLGTMRDEDILCRFGGEEFAIILRDTNEEKAFLTATRLLRLVEKTVFRFGGKLIPVNISIGIATFNDGTFADHEEMIKTADKHLYCAKRNGRNRVENALTCNKPR